MIQSGCVLSQLFAFRGLVRLELHLMSLNFDIQHVVDQLNCPQLMYLLVDLSERNWRVVPGNNLPSLEALHLHYNDCDNPGIPDMTDSTICAYLKALISRKIFFHFFKWTETDLDISFFGTVHQFSSGAELRSTLEWLIQGNYYFHKYWQFRGDCSFNTHENQRYDIDIRGLSASSRNYTIQIVQNLPQPYGFKISVYSSDSRNAMSILDILPRTISHLDISVQESIKPSLIPALIRSLLTLKSLVVNVYGRLRPSRSPTSAVNLIPSQTCTWASFSIPWDPEDDEWHQFSHDFSYLRGEQVRWRCKRWDVVDFPHGDLPEDVGSGTTELRSEITSWFHQNESVESIEFKVWAAYPWAFYFNEADIPEQDDIDWYDSEFEFDSDIETDGDVNDFY